MGYISVIPADRNRSMKEQFSGEVFDKPLTFPKGLGAKHPFEFNDAEKLYKRYGTLSGIINKITDSVVTDFLVKLDNENAQAIIDSFIADTNFHGVIREWVREGILKGNGFIEIDLQDTKIRVMNANNMYVKRNKVGKIIEYNQHVGNLNKFNRIHDTKTKDLIKFKPNQIAHLPLNKIPNDPYGIGFVWPSERVIENLIKNEQDQAELMTRKAGAPYHVKVGQPGEVTPPSVIDSVKANLEYLNNSHNWVTDGSVEITAINFDGLGKSLIESQMYFYRQLLAGMEVPEVMMGSGQLNEGIAKVQLETFARKVQSMQYQIASVIEEKIIRPLLKANGFDEKPLFIWDFPGEDIKDKRIMRVKELLGSNILIPAEMRAALNLELAKLMELEDLEKILITPQEAKKQEEEFQKQLDKENKEREQEENIPQPEAPGAKKSANETGEVRLKEKKQEMDLMTWVNLKEVAGFNYLDYTTEILKILKTYQFQDLAAITESDILNGMLTGTQVNKLRVILKNGFKQNQTIKQIEESIKNNIGLKDRLRDGKITASAKSRPINIARTETVRVANEGLISIFKKNKIEKVRWLSALSDRTCPECEALNGKVYEIDKAEMPPLHPMCRCSLISVIE